jgi:hypothetical protein
MSVDELMELARPLVTDGRVPSKSAIQKALRVRWDRVAEIHRDLAAEVEQGVRERQDRRRAMLAQRRARKTPGRQLTARVPALPAIPVSPGVAPIGADASGLVDPVPEGPAVAAQTSSRRAVTWPVVLLAMPAFVAIWSGWVDLGRLTGFGVVHPLPGIADEVALNTAITLPIGLETYAAYALYVWLSGAVPARARQFARRSAVGALVLGAGGQVAYHLMIAAGVARAPWWITTVVACLPVAVLGMGAALRHLVHAGEVSDE